jgi:hypothetical protein
MKRTLLIVMALIPFACQAGDVKIVNAEARKTGDQLYSFSVTLEHADTGWDHYADQWQVLTLDRQVLGTRTLYHPHVGEQPFTRSLGNVKVPAGLSTIIIKAHDKVHGVSPQTYELQLPQ